MRFFHQNVTEARLVRVRVLICLECGSRFIGLAKKDTAEVTCLYCSS